MYQISVKKNIKIIFKTKSVFSVTQFQAVGKNNMIVQACHNWTFQYLKLKVLLLLIQNFDMRLYSHPYPLLYVFLKCSNCEKLWIMITRINLRGSTQQHIPSCQWAVLNRRDLKAFRAVIHHCLVQTVCEDNYFYSILLKTQWFTYSDTSNIRMPLGQNPAHWVSCFPSVQRLSKMPTG